MVLQWSSLRLNGLCCVWIQWTIPFVRTAAACLLSAHSSYWMSQRSFNNVLRAKRLWSRADLRIFNGLLTGHANLNRHLPLMQIWTDAVCPLCQKDEETVLRLLGECSSLSVKHINMLGSPYISYEELGKVHWHALLMLAKASWWF